MDLKNLKLVEESNNLLYFKELNLLIQELTEKHKEMIFFDNALKTIKDLEICLRLKPLKKTQNLDIENINIKSHIPLNKFFTAKGQEYVLSKNHSIYLYEYLLKENLKITLEDQPLYDIIKKSIHDIYKKKNNNIEIELIHFLNIPIELLTFHLMHEFGSLIKYHPNTKNYNLYKTRFKLTTLSYNIGNLFLNIFIQNHKNSQLNEFLFLENNDISQNLHHFLEDFQQYSSLKDNKYFQKIFNITLKENKKKQIKICNNLDSNEHEFSYNVGQYFYNIIKTLFMISCLKRKTLQNTLLKNKLTEYKIKLGSVFMHAFKLNDLFYENIIWINKNKKNILFVPNMQYFPNIISNIVHQRPYFCYNTIESLILNYEKAKNDLNSTEYYIYNICITRFKLKIHKNPDIKLKPTNENSYNKLKMFSGKYYMEHFETLTSFIATIDKQYFYNFVLLLKNMLELKKNNNKFTFEQNIERFSTLFLLYKIQPKKLLEAYKTDNLTYKLLLENLLEYSLDFNTQNIMHYFKELKESLKPMTSYTKNSKEWLIFVKQFNFIKDLYNKIYSYKIFIKGFLSECFIYVHFDYFIFDSFLDTRGRHYLNGFFINPQSYPFIKAFIKPYVKNNAILDEKQFNLTKKCVLQENNIIKSREVSCLIENDLCDYYHYIKKEKKSHLEYIHQLFANENLTLNKLDNDLQNLYLNNKTYKELFESSLLYIKIHMTNIKKLFVLHSVILLFLKPSDNIVNYYELDATASGLQMTALVLRDATLGELCNLTSQKNKVSSDNDLYMIFSQDAIFWFLKYFDIINYLNISSHLKNICHVLFDYFNNNIYKTTKEIIVFIKKLKKLLSKEIDTKFHDILEAFNKFVWIIPTTYNSKNKNMMKLLIQAIKIKNKKHVIYEVLYKYIFLVGNFVFFNKCSLKINRYTWFFNRLNNRDIFKKAIMTFGYNATSFRRKQQFRKLLSEQALDYFSIEYIRNLSKILNNLFLILKDMYLASSQIIRDFGSLLAKKVKNYPHVNSSILIDNGIFEIEIQPNVKKELSFKVSGLLNKKYIWHELQINSPLYLKKKIVFSNDIKNTKNIIIQAFDQKILARKFAPNFIHSMDAWLICSFKYKIALLNRALNNKLFINHFTNHDTFSLSIASFLKYFIMDIYKNIYFFDYLCTLHHNYNYGNLLMLWFKKILSNTKIRKLNFRKEDHLKSSTASLYPIYVKYFGYHMSCDIGLSTHLILNPYFVK